MSTHRCWSTHACRSPATGGTLPPSPRHVSTCNVIVDNIRTGAPLLRTERHNVEHGSVALGSCYRILRCLSARRKIRAVCGVAENCFANPGDRHRHGVWLIFPNRRNRRLFSRNFAVCTTQSPKAHAENTERLLISAFLNKSLRMSSFASLSLCIYIFFFLQF